MSRPLVQFELDEVPDDEPLDDDELVGVLDDAPGVLDDAAGVLDDESDDEPEPAPADESDEEAADVEGARLDEPERLSVL